MSTLKSLLLEPNRPLLVQQLPSSPLLPLLTLLPLILLLLLHPLPLLPLQSHQLLPQLQFTHQLHLCHLQHRHSNSHRRSQPHLHLHRLPPNHQRLPLPQVLSPSKPLSSLPVPSPQRCPGPLQHQHSLKRPQNQSSSSRTMKNCSIFLMSIHLQRNHLPLLHLQSLLQRPSLHSRPTHQPKHLLYIPSRSTPRYQISHCPLSLELPLPSTFVLNLLLHHSLNPNQCP